MSILVASAAAANADAKKGAGTVQPSVVLGQADFLLLSRGELLVRRRPNGGADGQTATHTCVCTHTPYTRLHELNLFMLHQCVMTLRVMYPGWSSVLGV